MNKYIIALLIGGLSASATAGEFIPYYGNNPFLFCTLGVPQDCWVPDQKEYGTYHKTGRHCFNPYSANLYSRVCPQAFPNGANGKPTGQESADQPKMPNPNLTPNPDIVPKANFVARDPADASP
ncbi:hypothetical protein GCM10009552_19300 [Rothia nasimurium]|uniref:Uncharacterized protein n=1 Tax=Luteibacter anthropi TaxID=564369 RepID=A0A7X5U988_9GAMM|nr:hypothetical protein [Luteibacter anthropi]NII06281.1 hypothetical protein [Luteibacter anthropi]